MRPVPTFLLLCVVVSNAFAASRALDDGEIDGAKYAIALPAQWNRQVLLVAPALRQAEQPLTANFTPDDVAYKTLFSEGWIVAKTSFRRNGIVIADALADLEALRSYIAAKYGQPLRVIVEGEDLGGLVAVLIAERETRQPRLYDGVVAIGASLHLRENPATIGLSLLPRIPILFLANQSELEGPKGYIASPFAREADVVPPVLFRVARSGHANINQRERLNALRAINALLDRGPSALPRPPSGADPYFDATVKPEPRPSSAVVHGNGFGFDAHVTALSSTQGNVFFDAQPEDFATADIQLSTWFRLTIGDKSYRVFYGRNLDSVKRGEWVVIPGAEGNFILARYLGNAADAAKLAPGDLLSIQRFAPK